jgi:hypothetical protein
MVCPYDCVGPLLDLLGFYNTLYYYGVCHVVSYLEPEKDAWGSATPIAG